MDRMSGHLCVRPKSPQVDQIPVHLCSTQISTGWLNMSPRAVDPNLCIWIRYQDTGINWVSASRAFVFHARLWASGVVNGVFEPKIQIPDLLLCCLVSSSELRSFFPVLKSLCIYLLIYLLTYLITNLVACFNLGHFYDPEFSFFFKSCHHLFLNIYFFTLIFFAYYV